MISRPGHLSSTRIIFGILVNLSFAELVSDGHDAGDRILLPYCQIQHELRTTSKRSSNNMKEKFGTPECIRDVTIETRLRCFA